MLKPIIIQAQYKRVFSIAITILLMISCTLFTSVPSQSTTILQTAPPKRTAATSTSRYEKISYPTGIEVQRVPTNNVMTVIDRNGEYALIFPEYWDIGPVSKEFVSINKYFEINPALQIVFLSLAGQKDVNFRLFAVDTSPEHLSKQYFSVIHISITTDSGMLKHSLEEIAQMNYNSVPHSNDEKIIAKLAGKSAFDVPYIYIEMNSGPTNGHSYYSSLVYAKTSKALIQIIYITPNSKITISKELSLTIGSIVDLAKK